MDLVNPEPGTVMLDRLISISKVGFLDRYQLSNIDLKIHNTRVLSSGITRSKQKFRSLNRKLRYLKYILRYIYLQCVVGAIEFEYERGTSQRE